MKLMRRTTVLVLQILIGMGQASCSNIDEDQETKATSSSVFSNPVQEKSIWGIGEEQLDELFNNPTDLVSLTNSHFLCRVNSVWTKTLGWTQEQLLTKPFAYFTHPQNIADSIEIVEKLIENNLISDQNKPVTQDSKISMLTNFQTRHRTVDGTYLSSEWLALSKVSGDLTIAPLLGVGRDTTLQKQAEIQKQELEQAQLATRMKSTFVAHMSHELRTPLNGIIGFLDLALEEELSDSLKDYLTHARESAGLLLEIADNIVDVSRLEAGRLTLQSSVFNPMESLTTVVDSLKNQVGQKNIQLKCSTSASMPMLLQGDDYRFQQILSNLGSNAVKYTQQGKVSIKLKNYPVPDHPQKIMIRGRVKDTGIGINPQFIPKLFQPFSQEDQSMKRNFGGTGLGLYLTKELCERMGGSIHVLSTPSLGSTFEFKVIMLRADILP